MKALRRLDLIPTLLAGVLLLGTGMFQNLVHGVTIGETMFVELPSDYLGLTIDPRVIERFLGLRLVAADLIWIDTMIKSDLLHEKKAYTPLYRAFKSVTELDPDNLVAYYVAGTYLSVVKDDVHGATAILRDGVERLALGHYTWAGAWQLPWSLGYNLVFEENDIENGSEWIRKAAAMPNAPVMVMKIASHVNTERGRLEVAERVINDAYRRATRPEEKQRIEAKMVDVGVRHELVDLNERFQSFLKATKSSAFSKRRQFEIFKRAIGHSGRDMLGRPLGVNGLGRIGLLESAANQ